MKKLVLLLLLPLGLSAQKQVGGSCECCEAIYQRMPATLSWETRISDKDEEGEPMEITGIIYQKDGKTPAPNVILYVYHTDAKGNYSRGTGDACAKRHGKLRGWMQTDHMGRYKFVSIRPASYPNATIPAHIHPTIKEPNKNEYYIDEYRFEGDRFLTKEEIARDENRGGSGLIKLIKNDKGIWIGKRDIILGKNIPNY
ncbi:intradiol ring-cleavage dioxygenase [Emticicia sp. BO119]|uniref:dioxygenase family protein n=1 Tax=Emticicia sp. BO119 TaxID=2757768 RepID=UPI0015F1160C|nr:intradiol ring-cleavage dioxygenase [Emticicia sp. BO119]MBA4852276.1 intradiol ring-cleavage dioxygenase [Emticicia sp. BO119]